MFLLSPEETNSVTKKGKQGTILLLILFYVLLMAKIGPAITINIEKKKSYHGSCVSLFPFHCINSTFSMKLLQSLFFNECSLSKLCSFDSTTLSEVMPIDFNCP